MILGDDPVAYWRLGETNGTTVADQVGPPPLGTHPGSFVGSPTLGEPGAIVGDSDGCVRLTGDGAHVLIPNAADLNFVNAPFSLEAWVKKSQQFGGCSYGPCLNRIIDKITAGGVAGYGLDMSDQSIRTLGSCHTGPGCGGFSGMAYATSAGLWYHVVTTSDGAGHATTYVNGAIIETDDYRYTVANTGALLLGASSAGDSLFLGSIDEAAIYAYALSPLQVASHYLTGQRSVGVFGHPMSRTACPSGTASFAVTAAGTGPFTYQWQVRGGGGACPWVNLVDGVNPAPCGGLGFITVSGAQTAAIDVLDEGPAFGDHPDLFRVVVTNACGSVTSNPATLTICVADTDDGSGTGTCDGGVTIDDLLYYLLLFEQGLISADVDDGSGTGTPDGGVTIDDLLYYLFRFEAGC